MSHLKIAIILFVVSLIGSITSFIIFNSSMKEIVIFGLVSVIPWSLLIIYLHKDNDKQKDYLKYFVSCITTKLSLIHI